jgi:hypothetical protein
MVLVRPRRYVLTEVVTETEAGQRHELQVEREPIVDTEVAGVTASVRQPGEPALRRRPSPLTTTGSGPTVTLRADRQVHLLLP